MRLSHSGFLMIFFTLFRCLTLLSISSGKVSNMTRSEVKKGPFRAIPGSGPYPTEARFYPTVTLRVPGRGPGYRAQMAEDTVTKSRRQHPGYLDPEGSRAIEPRAPFSFVPAPCPLLPVLHRVPGSVPRVCTTVRYEPSRPPKSNTTGGTPAPFPEQ